MRIVIDTNVLISGLAEPKSNGAGVLRAWREGQFEVVSSKATLREAELVLNAGWLSRLTTDQQVKGLLKELRERTVMVQPRRLSDMPLKDEGDLRLVEAAVAGGAAYLVTADRELLLQRGYAGTAFVTPAELLSVLGSRAISENEGL
jgi:putative PIN family toxin of toxin-antitoxin system